jgi:hypothetical protein
MEYIYLGDKNIDQGLRKQPCSAVRINGNASAVKTVRCWLFLKTEKKELL